MILKVNVSKWCHVLVADLTIVQSGSLFRKSYCIRATQKVSKTCRGWKEMHVEDMVDIHDEDVLKVEKDVDFLEFRASWLLGT